MSATTATALFPIIAPFCARCDFFSNRCCHSFPHLRLSQYRNTAAKHMTATTKKGQIVAIEASKRTVYVPGSGRPSEICTSWTLARVTAATRDGVAKSVQRAGPGAPQQIKYVSGLKQVHTISDDRQAQAERVFASLNWDTPDWESADELKAAILAA